ncbi:hypothetical protein ACF07L_35245 [Streptomyces anulatus]|uniref:hypothetical protein n=1 Tax=Streptomyces anulatus TaxID=1892 RepID=UPI0036F64922
MSELTIALVGAGGALLGAAVGGAAAVVAAKMQATHAERSAQLAYLGPIDAARRSAQREAYARLLTAAHAFSGAATPALEAAQTLMEATDARAMREPPEVSNPALERARDAVALVRGPEDVVAAGQHVGLEGPLHLINAAKAVVHAVQELSNVFENAERIYEDADGRTHGLNRNAAGLHETLTACIDFFSDIASSHLNGDRI